VTRSIDSSYRDPLSEIWLETARRIGFEVERTGDAYASTDGRGVLLIATQETMDPDDCLAQMILHELCHFLVCGPESRAWVDWGLDNETTRDEAFEHACLRLQAALLTPRGLRHVLAPTTDFRAYYDALPVDAFELTSKSEQEAVIRARTAWTRRQRRPFYDHLDRALSATTRVLEQAAAFAPKGSLASKLTAETPLHSVGIPLHPKAGSPAGPRCESCAWASLRGPGKPVLRCVQTGQTRIDGSMLACEHFEHNFDCLGCGACCREAYDTVEVGPRDPAKKKHLQLMIERGGGHDMRREDGRCICLRGGRPLRILEPAISSSSAGEAQQKASPPLFAPGGEPFTCAIYEDRPQTCRDFTLGSANCLDARRRVGLSR
jgi:hypothetical protein